MLNINVKYGLIMQNMFANVIKQENKKNIMTMTNKTNNPAMPVSPSSGGVGEASLLYRQACNQYLALFCDKHGYDLRDAEWVGGVLGDIATIGDYFVGMRTIIDDLEMDAPEEEFIRWYDYCLEAHDLGIDSPNFRSWVKGCPRIPEERLQRLRDLRGALHEETEQLKKEFLQSEPKIP